MDIPNTTMTVKIVIIDKSSKAFTKVCKNISDSNIHTKCGVSNQQDFKHIHSFKCDYNIEKPHHYIHIFAKKSGRTNSINIAELPPPIDTVTLYGNIGIISTKHAELDFNEIQDYDDETWKNDYVGLFCGFEEIGSEDSERSIDEEAQEEGEDSDQNTEEQNMKTGYKRDGFVVDSDNSDDNSDAKSDFFDSELEEEDYYESGADSVS